MPRTDELLHAHRARLDAVLAGDTNALADVVSEDLVYIGPDGAVRTRAEVFAAIDGGALRVERMVPRNEHVRLFGDVGIIVYDADASMVDGDRRVTGMTRSTTVYVHRHGRWQMVSQHQGRLDA
jgi:ketosteroid isomerase-like protein